MRTGRHSSLARSIVIKPSRRSAGGIKLFIFCLGLLAMVVFSGALAVLAISLRYHQPLDVTRLVPIGLVILLPIGLTILWLTWTIFQPAVHARLMRFDNPKGQMTLEDRYFGLFKFCQSYRYDRIAAVRIHWEPLPLVSRTIRPLRGQWFAEMVLADGKRFSLDEIKGHADAVPPDWLARFRQVGELLGVPVTELPTHWPE